jgi:hypothetical protein
VIGVGTEKSRGLWGRKGTETGDERGEGGETVKERE